MTTILDKELKRQISVDGADFTVVLDPQGLRLLGKGKRRPEVALRWSELVNGDAALAVALNASVSSKRRAEPGATAPAPPRTAPVAKKPTR